jgi:parvulin-like peptidyl-prolyl isomerase
VKTPARTITALLALVLAAALVGASCSSVTPQALSVGDWTLSEREFLDDLQSVADNQAYLDARAAQGQPVQLEGEVPGSWSTQFTAEYLQERVTFALAEQENERRGLEVTDEDRREAEVLLSQSLSGAGASGTSSPDPAGVAILDGFSSSYREALVGGVANLLVLQDDIITRSQTEEGLRALFEAQQEETGGQEQACASHILVQAGTGQAAPTEQEYATALAEVQQIAAELEGGADFATLAEQRSDDPGSAAQGGELGCQPEGTYVTEFDEAVWSQPVGQVGEPVRTDFGYHLVLVTARGQLTFEDVRDQLAQAVEQNQQALLSDWLEAASGDAEIGVDPKFGRWDAEQARVVPPSAAQPAGGVVEDPLAGVLGGTGAG